METDDELDCFDEDGNLIARPTTGEETADLMRLTISLSGDHLVDLGFPDVRSGAWYTESIAAPVETLPDSWIIAPCPLCKEERRYFPAEIFRGRLSWGDEQAVRRAGRV
jgi:hypothetical protein